MSPAKCHFHQNAINYLGFLGVCGFYCHLISDFANLRKSLINVSILEARSQWGLEPEEAFQILQKIFFQNLFIQLPDLSSRFILSFDVSSTSILAVLLQEKSGQLTPILYNRRSPRVALKRYISTKIRTHGSSPFCCRILYVWQSFHSTKWL